MPGGRQERMWPVTWRRPARPAPTSPRPTRSSPSPPVRNRGRAKRRRRPAAPESRRAAPGAPPPTAGPAGHPGRSQPGARPGGAAVRRRLARLGAPRGGGVNPVLEPLIKTVRATHPKADIRLIERAYEVAAHWHAGQKRKSGDPYITHPLAVATILAELGMNHETICAALLHDTVEDTAVHAGRAAPGLRRRRGGAGRRGHQAGARSSTARPPRPRPSARWSSRCPATSGCW